MIKISKNHNKNITSIFSIIYLYNRARKTNRNKYPIRHLQWWRLWHKLNLSITIILWPACPTESAINDLEEKTPELLRLLRDLNV
jgi:hypothetical protein